jgi:hypothetical protein
VLTARQPDMGHPRRQRTLGKKCQAGHRYTVRSQGCVPRMRCQSRNQLGHSSVSGRLSFGQACPANKYRTRCAILRSHRGSTICINGCWVASTRPQPQTGGGNRLRPSEKVRRQTHKSTTAFTASDCTMRRTRCSSPARPCPAAGAAATAHQ